VRVAGRNLYAWCAWDTLVPPSRSGPAETESAGPTTGATTRSGSDPGDRPTSHPRRDAPLLAPARLGLRRRCDQQLSVPSAITSRLARGGRRVDYAPPATVVMSSGARASTSGDAPRGGGVTRPPERRRMVEPLSRSRKERRSPDEHSMAQDGRGAARRGASQRSEHDRGAAGRRRPLVRQLAGVATTATRRWRRCGASSRPAYARN
jgi:hypothetical protein